MRMMTRGGSVVVVVVNFESSFVVVPGIVVGGW